MLNAPRILKAPIGCRFSHLRKNVTGTGSREPGLSAVALAKAEAGPDTSSSGVSRAAERMRSRAAWMSAMETRAVVEAVVMALLLADVGELVAGVVGRHRRLGGDAPPELGQHLHVLDPAGEVPRRVVLVAGLVIVGVVVGFLLLQQLRGARTGELLRLADRQ